MKAKAPKGRMEFQVGSLFIYLLLLSSYLHYNLIQDFQPATFSNLTKLERLFLHNNRIQRIPHGSFDNLHEMKRL